MSTPDHWRRRAVEATVEADGMADPVAKIMMLDIARNYYNLAKRAQARTTTGKLALFPKVRLS